MEESKENEYKALFISEALSNTEELNRLMTQLESNKDDLKSIDAIFRITHTLKGNAAGMGFDKIARFSHVLEDLFSEIKNGVILLDEDMFTVLFKSLDVLYELVNALSNPENVVRYRGVQRRLEVIINRAKGIEDSGTPAQQENKESEAIPVVDEAADTPNENRVASDAHDEIMETAEEEQNSPKTLVEEEKHEVVEPVIKMQQTEEKSKIVFSDLVQVPVKKLDNLLNLVGELIIERDRLMTDNDGSHSRNEFSRLNRISSDLQYSVMDVRLVQVNFLFNKFHRVVRDAAKYEGKEVELVIVGSDTEIDRNILQIISDSLIHLIRNAIGHGIESPEEREKAGKTKKGTLILSARNESEGVLIEIIDDGKGLDTKRILQKAINKGWVDTLQGSKLTDDEIISFIFQPGFSTNEVVNDISGRGVGMDVVKRALDSIGGNIKVETEPGQGSTFALMLPSSMAVKGTLLFELSHTQYAIPLSYTEAVLSIKSNEVRKVQNRLMISHLGKTIEAIYLKDFFFNSKDTVTTGDQEKPEKLHVIVVQYSGKKVGFIVDKLLQQKEIVEKPLKKPVDFLQYISGVTILGNGNVCLVLNVPQIIQGLFYSVKNIKSAAVA